MTKLAKRLSWKKTLIAGAVGISVLGVTASPVFAAENIFQRIQRSVSERVEKVYLQVIPGDKPGKLVMKQMSVASQNLKSFKGDTTVDVEMIGGGQTVGSAQLTASGPTVVGEVWNPQTYKQEMSLKGQFSVQGTTLSATADIKMIDGVTYVKLNQLPALPNMSFDEITGTWIKFDPAAQGLEKQDTTLTADQMQRMQEAFNKMINSADAGTAKAEKKDGNNVYVVTVTVSKPAVVEYVTTVTEIQREIMVQSVETEEEREMLTSQQDPEEMKQSLEGILDSMGEIKATFWVDKGNYYPRRFELPLEIDVQKLGEQAEAAQALQTSAAGSRAPQVEKVKFNIVSNTSEFDQTFNITVPEGAEDAQLFFSKVMGSMGAPSMITGSGSVGTPTTPSMLRQPSVGTSELPGLTPEQKRQIEQYEKMMGEPLPMMDY